MKKNISLVIHRKNEKKYDSVFSYPIVKNFVNDHFLSNHNNNQNNNINNNTYIFTKPQHSFFFVINQLTQFLISKIKLIVLFLLVFISLIKLT